MSAETMARVRERCSLDFMKKHESKLDPERAYFGGRGIVFSNFVREGKTDAWRTGLDDRQKQVYRERFQRVLGGRGLDHYLPS
ncbi:MAG: sulfotransferase domain-containing protein [Thermoanaerobaculia bacterium]|nr:sulfotransferase domain-containing protein [Thermoanaerobaculia bacterium]